MVRSRLALIILSALLLSLVAVWFSFPLWAPALGARVLPEGWRLGEARLDYPGWSAGTAERLVLEGPAAGLLLRIEIEGVTLRYGGPELDVERLRVFFRPGPGAGPRPPGRPPRLADFALPRVPLPGELPRLAIGRLELVQDLPPGQRWIFEGVDLARAEDGLELAGGMQDPPFLRVPARFELRLSEASLLLRLYLGLADRRWTLLEFREIGTEDGATANLSLDGDLAWLEPSEISPWTERLGLGGSRRLQGRVQGVVGFAGAEQLLPESLEFTARDLAIRTGAGLLAGELELNAHAEGGGVAYRAERLDLLADGAFPGTLALLRRLLEDAGFSGLPGDEPLVARLSLLTSVRGRLAAEDLRRMEGHGGLRLSWAQAAGRQMTLEAPDARWRAGPGELAVDGALTGALATATPFGWSTGDLSLRLTGLETGFALAGSGTAAAVGANTEVTGAIQNGSVEVLEFENQALAARIENMAAEGEFALAAGTLKFEGPLEGTRLEAQLVEEENTGLEVRFGAFALTLDAALSDGLRVSGGGELYDADLPGLGVGADRLDVSLEALTLPTMEGAFSLATTGLRATLDGERRTGLDLDVEGVLGPASVVEGEGELLLGVTGELPFGYRADLESGELTARLRNAGLDARGVPAALRFLALPAPRDLSFVSGLLVLDGAVTLGEAGPTGQLAVRGEELELALGESTIEGLSFVTDLDLGEVLAGGGGLELRLLRLAAGLDVVSLDTDIEIRGGGDFSAIGLDAGLLDGSLAIPALRFTGGELHPTTIRWRNFDLGGLLAFVDVGGLDGSGRIDAEFPLRTEAGNPVVEGGSFRALGPGRLRYRSGAPAGNIGLQALENFQYETLEGTLDYGADGGYLIGLELLGSNPELYDGYPIRFRLNLSGELPALARSLFVTGDFGQAILEQLKSGALGASQGQK